MRATFSLLAMLAALAYLPLSAEATPGREVNCSGIPPTLLDQEASLSSLKEGAVNVTSRSRRQDRTANLQNYSEIAQASGTTFIEYIEQRWTGTQWRDVERLSVTFDSEDRTTEETFQLFRNNNWVNEERYLYEYEGQKTYPSLLTYQIWSSGQWTTELVETAVVNENNLPVEIIIEDWTDPLDIIKDREVISYDHAGRITQVLLYLDDWIDGGWELDSRTRWTYSEYGVLLSIISEYYNGNWTADSQTLYYYDDEFNNIRQVTQINVFTWRNLNRSQYVYDKQGNQIERTSQFWSNGRWTNLSKTETEYKHGCYPLHEVRYSDSVDGWNPVSRNSFTYSNEGILTLILTQERIGSTWVNASRIVFGDAPPTDASHDDLLPFLFELKQNYPNPFNPSTSIVFSLPYSDHVSLSVYDVLGRKVIRLLDGPMREGDHSIYFDAAGLTSGVYIYRLSVGHHTESRYMTLLK